MPQNLLRIEDVARLLCVPRQRCYELFRQGRIPGLVRLGRQLRVQPDRLHEFINRGGAPLAAEEHQD